MARGKQEADRFIGKLLKKRDVLFLEILRFNSLKTTQAEIRSAIGRWPYPTAFDSARGAQVPDQKTIH
jgi:hypothetical protein